jgi:hypothetical protein
VRQFPDVAGRVEQAEDFPARHALDAVLAAGEGGLDAEEVDHLRQRQRHHGEVDPLPSDGDETDDETHDRGDRDRGDECDLGCDLRQRQHRARERHGNGAGLQEMRRDIGADAEEHRVPEREQPDVADEQVEGGREQREAQHLDEEHRVGHERRRDQCRQKDGEDQHVLGSLHDAALTSPFRRGQPAAT